MRIQNIKTLKGTKFERIASQFFLIFSMAVITLITSSFIVIDKSPRPYSTFVKFDKAAAKMNHPSLAKASFRGQSDRFPTMELFDFNPNTASKQDFIKLGISSHVANTILNFRKKNGRFYQPEDLQKIYGLRKEDYQRLKKFIKIKSTNPSPKTKQSTNNQPIAKLFQFNPNEASKEDFLLLGLSPKLSQRIVKYRNKGGHFYKKEDIKKIYGFADVDYQRLVDYIVVPPQEEKVIAQSTFAKKKPAASQSTSPQVNIDINRATAEEWQQLKGIGSGYAKRILTFRSLLGGFSSIEQVSTAYNFPDSVFQKIKPFLTASTILNKININQATQDELKKHPYLSWKQAERIVKYRKQNGDFEVLEDLMKIYGAFKVEDLERLSPYLAFE